MAVPHFAASAMGNWGLITFNEAALLFDPEISPSTQKQEVANVIARKLAHQVSDCR